jgi:hypothetical protein
MQPTSASSTHITTRCCGPITKSTPNFMRDMAFSFAGNAGSGRACRSYGCGFESAVPELTLSATSPVRSFQSETVTHADGGLDLIRCRCG